MLALVYRITEVLSAIVIELPLGVTGRIVWQLNGPIRWMEVPPNS